MGPETDAETACLRHLTTAVWVTYAHLAYPAARSHAGMKKPRSFPVKQSR